VLHTAELNLPVSGTEVTVLVYVTVSNVVVSFVDDVFCLRLALGDVYLIMIIQAYDNDMIRRNINDNDFNFFH